MPFSDYRQVWMRPDSATPTGRARRHRKRGPLVAWELLTTPEPQLAGDRCYVDPLHLHVEGADGVLVDRELAGPSDLAHVFADALLTKADAKTRYVSWGELRRGAVVLFRALLEHRPEYAIDVFTTSGGQLRGAKISLHADPATWWEICDGQAMFGLDLERDQLLRTFGASSLYGAIAKADAIMYELTGRGARMTIGRSAIDFLGDSLPEDARIAPVPGACWSDLFASGMRGGYCYTARQHDGPMWQYDLNQAYAAAMRMPLPNGRAVRVDEEHPGRLGIYRCRISRKERSPIPFVCRTDGESVECYGEETPTLILSCEIETLRRHGWTVDVFDGWTWRGSWNASEMVDRFECLRTAHGPSSPVGLIAKSLGCNAYGKTAERQSCERVSIAARCPEGARPWRIEDPELAGFWVKLETPTLRRYHRPQIAAFVTAYVRMWLYDAIMAAPEAFLKADTDSVAFSRPVAHLELNPTRYGAWKVEYAGERAIVIGKKAYAVDVTPPRIVCTGLHPEQLTIADFERWHRTGEPPAQLQFQVASWKWARSGEQYRMVVKHGTDFRRYAPHLFEEKAA